MLYIDIDMFSFGGIRYSTNSYISLSDGSAIADGEVVHGRGKRPCEPELGYEIRHTDEAFELNLYCTGIERQKCPTFKQPRVS